MQKNGPADLRRRVRAPAAIKVGLVSKVGELKSDTSASTINVSLTGVRVRTKLALVPRQEVAVVIEGQFSQTLAGRVVWAREDKSSHRTTAGIKFAA